IPRTVSCLSNINDIRHIDTAADLIAHHKRSGNVFINLTGNTGLTLFASIPQRFGHKFISAFKRNPKAFIGITKSHLIIHVIKILDKYRLVAVFMPFIALALILSILPDYLVWTIFIGSAGYLVFIVVRKFKHKSEPKKKGR
ncbi:MAG: hypothetical protein KAR07_08250, partial [Spirochaetes bacterium]|nr:hypothetical protein [Spirochaetota bacterium]